jgi:apolipoprotein D and lipocalin family protein
MRHSKTLIWLSLLLALAACRSGGVEQPIKPVSQVNLSRYMGRWYVIASIPTRFWSGGYDQVETYRLEPDGRIDTSFRFRRGSFQGPPETIPSVATVVPGSSNTEWKVRLFWLLREQYIVAWLAPDYSRVIVARDARDYVWLMARTPQISAAEYRSMLARVRAMGYDLRQLRKVPQRVRASSGRASSESPAPLGRRRPRMAAARLGPKSRVQKQPKRSFPHALRRSATEA